MKKIFVIIVLIVGLAIASYLIISPKPTKEVIVRIALPPYTGDLPFYAAIEKGYFADQKLNIEIIQTKESSEALNALLAGKVDIIAPISFSALLAAEIKSPGEFKLFLPGGESDKIIGSYLLIKKDSTIKEIKELKGKKIGTYTGATQLLYLKLFLKEVGFDPDKDITIIQVAPELQAQALEANQYDALFTIEPYSTIAIQKLFAKVLIENPRVKYIVNPFISGSAAVSSKFVKENPKILKKIYKALAQGLDFIRTNETGAREILPKYTPLDASLAQKAGLIEWYKVDEPVNYGAIQKISDLLYENKILSSRIEVRNMFLERNQLE
jgi:NitT/TauT family transport system substrate-binding protein